MKKSDEMSKKVVTYYYNKFLIDRKLQIVRVENEIRIAKFDERDNNFLYYSFEHDILKLINVNLENKIFNINIVILIKKMFLTRYLSFIKYVFKTAKKIMFQRITKQSH